MTTPRIGPFEVPSLAAGLLVAGFISLGVSLTVVALEFAIFGLVLATLATAVLLSAHLDQHLNPKKEDPS